MQKRIQQLLEQIAKDHSKPLYVIEEIYLSQFRATRDQIRSLEFKTIKLPSWGKYIASQSKLDKIQKYKDIKNNESDGKGTNSNSGDAIQGDKRGDSGGEKNKDIPI